MLGFRKQNNKEEENAKESQAFKKAKDEAEDCLKNGEKAEGIIEKAEEKAKKGGRPIKKLARNLATFIRLGKAWIKGEYRDLTWQSTILIFSAIIYFVMPFDLIPDFILGFGFLDDAAIFAWVARSLTSELDKFREWENRVE